MKSFIKESKKIQKILGISPKTTQLKQIKYKILPDVVDTSGLRQKIPRKNNWGPKKSRNAIFPPPSRPKMRKT